MTANKPVTPPASRIGSDLAKVDAHEITPDEYEEIPELSDEWFATADLHIGGKLVRRGRPKSATAKQPVSLRLDPDVVAHFKASGPGWQSRMNAALRSAMETDDTPRSAKKR